jgi:DinB superfamily
MTTATLNNPLLVQYLQRIEDINRHARNVLENTTDLQLRWVPPEGGWSIGLVFEHLIKGGGLYNDLLDKVISDARRHGVTGGSKRWKPTMVGKFLAKAMRSPRKIPTFQVFEPGRQVSEQVLERFLAVQDGLMERITEADGLDLSRVRMRSPLSALIRFNLGDCFLILIDHAIRHLRQVEDLQNHPRFPIAPTG